MYTRFKLTDLFIYDLANNHQGDIDHAANIVREVARVNNAAGVRGALKFQFRQLDTFIHPDFKNRTDIKYVKRFTETRLSKEHFATLAKLIHDSGLYTMCTPFDEESVDILCDMGLDIIKVASCSADDRPLLERIARVNKPVVVSTAGLRVDEIDWLVNFLESEDVNFALMHCVAEYPTPDERLQLNQISQMIRRYARVPIGWSTHENQDNCDAVQIAYAFGARLFERHVGLNTDKYKLNNYSSTPAQLENWLAAYKSAQAMSGAAERPPSSTTERATLHELKRGVYARSHVAQGEPLTRENVFFAMPVQEGQLTSAEFRPGMLANCCYQANAPVTSALSNYESTDEQLVYQVMLQIRGMLTRANIYINPDAEIEISHHYGLRRFREFGAVIVTCINRKYAKKLIIQLPRQKHPYHLHRQKEESFQLLYGDIEIVKNGVKTTMLPGDICLVESGVWHKFQTLGGAVIEEVSTTHYNNDSVYDDPTIANLPREQRKTRVANWRAYFHSKHAF
jgi:sialic acid synthase SpsE/mannose-6-phosphate isomerase-like protein (cupin superfamily)